MAGATGPPWSTLDPPLCDASLAALDALGFPTMTPVQAATIPVFLSHKDVSVQAVTGSGKTYVLILSNSLYFVVKFGLVLVLERRDCGGVVTGQSHATEFSPSPHPRTLNFNPLCHTNHTHPKDQTNSTSFLTSSSSK